MHLGPSKVRHLNKCCQTNPGVPKNRALEASEWFIFAYVFVHQNYMLHALSLPSSAQLFGGTKLKHQKLL